MYEAYVVLECVWVENDCTGRVREKLLVAENNWIGRICRAKREVNGVITRKHWNEESFQKDVLTNLRRAGRMNVRREIDKESISAGDSNVVAYNSANISMHWSSFCYRNCAGYLY